MCGAPGVLTALYSWVFFYLFVAGGGAWSLDALLRRETPARRSASTTPLSGAAPERMACLIGHRH